MNARPAVATALCLFAACAAAPPGDLAFATLDGRRLHPLLVAPGRVHVLFFVVPDCPIANAYAPAIEGLWQAVRGSEVDCVLVQCDPDLDTAAARRHAAEYRLTMPCVLDPRQQLAQAVGATRTPEVAVLTAAGLQYRGRIDDRWRGRGQDGQVPEHDDLLLAIAAVRQGLPVPQPRTEAVGCQLPEPRR